jgi:hypothetical protein
MVVLDAALTRADVTITSPVAGFVASESTLPWRSFTTAWAIYSSKQTARCP